MKKIFLPEFKKLLRLGHFPLVALAAVLLTAVLSFLPNSHPHPYSDEVYKQYTARLKGKLTQEKLKALEDRLTEIESLISAYEQMQQNYQRGEIDLTEYPEFTQRHGQAQAERSTVAYMCQKYRKLIALKGFDKQIFCDTPWADFFEDNTLDLVMLFALLCVAVPAFDVEFGTSSAPLLLTSKYGKSPLAVAKLASVALSVFALSLTLSAVRLTAFACQSGLPNANAAAANLLLSQSTGKTTLIGYFLIDALLKAMAYTFYALAACLIASACKNTAFSFVISFLACVTPLFLVENNQNLFLCASVLRKMYSSLPPVTFAAVTLCKQTAVVTLTPLCWKRKQ